MWGSGVQPQWGCGSEAAHQNWFFHFSDICWALTECITNQMNFFLSKVFKLTWKMQNLMNRKKNQISDFSQFHFSSYGHFCTLIFDEFFTITLKLKIRKLFFHSIQHISYLPWKWDQNWGEERWGLHILRWEKANLQKFQLS